MKYHKAGRFCFVSSPCLVFEFVLWRLLVVFDWINLALLFGWEIKIKLEAQVCPAACFEWFTFI